MQIEVTKEEMTIVLDGLATLPLAKSYNVFNKLIKVMQSEVQNAVPGLSSTADPPADSQQLPLQMN